MNSQLLIEEMAKVRTALSLLPKTSLIEKETLVYYYGLLLKKYAVANP